MVSTHWCTSLLAYDVMRLRTAQWKVWRTRGGWLLGGKLSAQVIWVDFFQLLEGGWKKRVESFKLYECIESMNQVELMHSEMPVQTFLLQWIHFQYLEWFILHWSFRRKWSKIWRATVLIQQLGGFNHRPKYIINKMDTYGFLWTYPSWTPSKWMVERWNFGWPLFGGELLVSGRVYVYIIYIYIFLYIGYKQS